MWMAGLFLGFMKLIWKILSHPAGLVGFLALVAILGIMTGEYLGASLFAISAALMAYGFGRGDAPSVGKIRTLDKAVLVTSFLIAIISLFIEPVATLLVLGALGLGVIIKLIKG